MDNKNLTIKFCIDRILETMHDLGYGKGTIERYAVKTTTNISERILL